MLNFSYLDLGAGKRLNQIVMAGSHDAAITKGGGNAKTQKLNIFAQAEAGVRVFDLRVTGADVKENGQRMVKLTAYHANSAAKTNVKREVVGFNVGNKTNVKVGVNIGIFGEELLMILNNAKSFVTTYSTEFLILKFDKCKNWEMIAEVCVNELAHSLYKGGGNLNTKRLVDLKGKVIVLFGEEGLAQIPQRYKGTGGILSFKNLSGGGGYEPGHQGLQYHGKGGTDLNTRLDKCIQENYDKQLGLMRAGVEGNPEVMGMMYWTTTGLVGNIRQRNKMMWQPNNVNQMMQLWASGMGDAVRARIPSNMNPLAPHSGVFLKRFLPNIVMIDFASERKCRTIFELNRLIPEQLTKFELLMLELRKLAG